MSKQVAAPSKNVPSLIGVVDGSVADANLGGEKKVTDDYS